MVIGLSSPAGFSLPCERCGGWSLLPPMSSMVSFILIRRPSLDGMPLPAASSQHQACRGGCQHSTSSQTARARAVRRPHHYRTARQEALTAVAESVALCYPCRAKRCGAPGATLPRPVSPQFTGTLSLSNRGLAWALVMIHGCLRMAHRDNSHGRLCRDCSAKLRPVG